MKQINKLFCLIILLPLLAQAQQDTGEVRVPLSRYQELLQQNKKPVAPAAYAIGHNKINISLAQQNDQTTAQVTIESRIEIFQKHWTLVPLLPLGVALSHASIDGQPVQLVQTADGLAWSTEQSGAVTIYLSYSSVARRSEQGYTLALPVPQAAVTELELNYPGVEVDIAIVPAAEQHNTIINNHTRIKANIPPTTSILASWRAAGLQDYAISRARYRGELQDQAVTWVADYQVEVFSNEPLKLPLLPSNITLVELSIDGAAATVVEQNQQFVTLISGIGLHQVQAIFQVPVQQADGPPHITLQVPRVPMSQFDLVLSGEKEVKVSPQANVSSKISDGKTEASVFMPMVSELSFAWLDAIPEDLQIQTRANTSVYHALHAEEGVLHGHAVLAYEISRGDTNLLEFTLPQAAQVNRVQGSGVADWTETASAQQRKQIKVFLDRAVKGDYTLEVFYELLLSDTSQAITAPLLSAVNVQRQRGMVALLAGPELALKPASVQNASAVGENQLPAFVRNKLQMTVAHTYKYTELPTLAVLAAAPERKQGKFDAQVDTLISIGEVTLKGAASIEVNVKTGSVMQLGLQLPENINILGVTAPALRSRQVSNNDASQLIALEFTREMDGQFRVEVNYERIMADSAAETTVPTITVIGAEVEHGRIAIEALTAVEVKAATAEQLSTLDINELPQQLILKTTNPILLAYKYVGSGAQLALKMIRHKEIEVQVAAIEQAHYRTLFTRDGLAVTSARFTVRNSRRQFLRLQLPADSEVWSTFVDGKAEKPAHAGDAKSAVLIKLINSASGFTIDMVYATPVAKIEDFGTIAGSLPRPDMVVTQTRWDVYMPYGPSYRVSDSNLDSHTDRGRRANPRQEAGMTDNAQPGQALRIHVPTQGVHFAFTKLYANQATADSKFTIRYVALPLNRAGLALSALATILVWLGIIGLWKRSWNMSRAVVVVLLVAGIALLLAAIVLLQTDPLLASGLSLGIAVLCVIWLLIQRLRAWRAARA